MSRRRAVRPRGERSESGYALITILFMLGVVAVMLARSLPRDAMRAERTREETLIYRGEEYARAVKLYFRQHKRYPESLDDLEETDGVRFLRRRYRDPMTGEDEWRLIKMGSDGTFEDSLVYDTEKDDGGPNATPAAQAFAAAGLAIPRAPNAATQQRESAAPGNPFDPEGTYAGAFRGGVTAAEDPNGAPANEEGQPRDGSEAVDPPLLPNQVPTDTQQRNDRRLNSRSSRAGAQAGQVMPYGLQPSTGGGPLGENSISPQASDVIGRLLTTPRPGGLAGIQAQQNQQQAGQAAFQEGIAGVASKSERSGVKVYKDREFYNEWEFVYDYRDDPTAGGVTSPGLGVGGNINQGQPGLTPSGSLGGNPGAGQTGGNPFGGQPRTPPDPTIQPTVNDDPREARRDRRRGSRFGPRSPAEYRPATPVPPPPPDDQQAFPGQVNPGQRQRR